jgi:hypothetical protein
MKILFLSFLCVAGVAAQAVDNPSLAGNWQVSTSISGTQSDMACTFTQKDDALTGNCIGERGSFEITGKIADGKVTWSYKTEYNGTPLTVKYSGAMTSAISIKGSVDVPEFGVSGDFTANQSK